MLTQTLTHSDGTRSTYTAAPGSDLFMRLSAIKPARKPALARAHKRQFPVYRPGVTSTADYIRQYFGLNSGPKIAAYPRHETDWLRLYEPLPGTPAAVYTGVDTVETIED
jgi:hypothetical protein